MFKRKKKKKMHTTYKKSTVKNYFITNIIKLINSKYSSVDI